MSSYFDVLSWTRARKNREALEKTNPQNPVLNDDDEQFLQRITSQEAPAPQLPDIEPTVIDDDGVKTKADATQKEAAAIILPADAEAKEKRTWASYIPSVNNVASSIPSMPAIPSMPSLASLRSAKTDGKTDETKAEQADSMSEKVEQVAQQDETSAVKPDQQDKIDTEAKSEIVTDQDPNEAKSESTSDEVNPESKHVETEADKTDEPAQRTWASYIPAMPAISSIGRNAKGKEAEQTPEAKEQEEREVSVLLDRLNLSAINNRVFSFSDQSQKLYGQFTLILKDMVNGVPTAYQDMETLLKDNEKQLEGMFKSMPPFVQTLVKSLPAKFATSMGPEIMAMAGDKPGNDLKKRMEAASQASSSVSSMNLDVKKKQKRRIPGVKDLASQKGTVTSMLTNIVNFLKLRFPAFVTGTNVVMSLAVFILLFVFWYCHKRGKEVRLLRENESTKTSAEVSEVSDTDEDEKEEEAEEEKKEEEKPEIMAEQESSVPDATEKVKSQETEQQVAGLHKSSVGGPDNAAAARAKKILQD